MDEFLASQGKKVKVVDVENNQLIACNYLLRKEGQVRVYCIKKVETNPQAPHLVPPLPRAYLYKSHVGMSPKRRFYIHVPYGNDYRDAWMPEEKAIEEWWGEDILNNKWYGDHYTVTDPELVRLGNLIPKLEIPEFSAIYQNEDANIVFNETNRLLPLIDSLKEIKENWKK